MGVKESTKIALDACPHPAAAFLYLDERATFVDYIASRANEKTAATPMPMPAFFICYSIMRCALSAIHANCVVAGPIEVHKAIWYHQRKTTRTITRTRTQAFSVPVWRRGCETENKKMDPAHSYCRNGRHSRNSVSLFFKFIFFCILFVFSYSHFCFFFFCEHCTGLEPLVWQRSIPLSLQCGTHTDPHSHTYRSQSQFTWHKREYEWVVRWYGVWVCVCWCAAWSFGVVQSVLFIIVAESYRNKTTFTMWLALVLVDVVDVLHRER